MATEVSTKKQKKDKGKKKSTRTNVDSGGKNEGVDLSSAFQPPPGSSLVQNVDMDAGVFDWDAINADEDLEMWIMRVPENVKPKHLEGLSLDVPPSSSGTRKENNRRIGSLKRKNATYDIWCLGDPTIDTTALDGEIPPVGGEEIRSLSCLLPRKSKHGKLYSAPGRTARHIVISAQPPQPSQPDPHSSMSSTNGSSKLTNPPRQRYPPELLKHRFIPYGSLVQTLNGTRIAHDEDGMMIEVDHNVSQTTFESTDNVSKGKDGRSEAAPEREEKERKSKSKKRKGEDAEDTAHSKKSKKLRTTG